MGLGLTFKAEWPKTLSGKRFEEWLDEFSRREGWPWTVIQEPSGTTCLLHIHPAVEPMRLTLGQGMFTGEAQTSGAGPGYHQYITEVLDKIGQAHSLQWDVRDETGYYEDYNRAALEENMMNWLGQLADLLGDQLAAGRTNIAVGMPLHWRPVKTPYKILTPMGPRDEHWVTLVREDRNNLKHAFPWWNWKRDSRYWRNLGLVLCWMEVCWVSSLEEKVRAVQKRAADAFAKAFELDDTIDIPYLEWARLYRLLNDPADEIKVMELAKQRNYSKPFRGGYRMHDVWWELPEGWGIVVPGALGTPEFDQDGTWSVGWGDMTAHFTARVVQGANASELLSDFKEPQGTVERLASAKPAGRAAIAPNLNEGGFVLQGQKAVQGSVGLVTVWYRNKDQVVKAKQIWESLSHS